MDDENSNCLSTTTTFYKEAVNFVLIGRRERGWWRHKVPGRYNLTIPTGASFRLTADSSGSSPPLFLRLWLFVVLSDVGHAQIWVEPVDLVCWLAVGEAQAEAGRPAHFVDVQNLLDDSLEEEIHNFRTIFRYKWHFCIPLYAKMQKQSTFYTINDSIIDSTEH